MGNVIEGDHGRLTRILGPKGTFKNLDVRLPDVAGDGGDSLDSRKGQGTMFAYGQPNPDAVIVNRGFETA